jgi:acyl carrier protein
LDRKIIDYRPRIAALSTTKCELLALRIGKRRASSTGLKRLSDNKRLVAYVVLETGTSPTLSEWRNYLSRSLPEYMVPSAFVVLDTLPLTAGGKVDRRSLPGSDELVQKKESSYAPPQTEVEGLVAGVWREVLNLERVGLYDNFFDLGGHSLLMVQVHSRLREKLEPDLTMIDLFKYPTVSTLARFLSEETSAPEVSSQPTHDQVRSRRKSSQRQRQVRQDARAGKDL